MLPPPSDPIAMVTIVLPDDYSDGSLPSRVELVFSSNYTTLYGTNLTGTIVYSWDFDDGGAGGSAATVTHTYLQAKSYAVRLSVHNFVGDIAQTVTQIVVYVGKWYHLQKPLSIIEVCST